ncbi:type VI secretion system accessory protein TagJ [Granulicella arctica]|uniref:type VI secretion system accessory protein TagJ n=1 Tax=Granulicella arctica TaxID=940613 RepID=UPI0021DFCAE4|nr:type VI secretion system accessory protein TagJ [Granulicella arctica]
MTALDLYRNGELKEAIKVLGEELRSHPLDAKRRTFLFELLCFAGNFDRAEKQLDVLADSSTQAAAGALMYRSALHAERTRQDLFAKRTYPEAISSGESQAGTWNGENFSSLHDADPRIGANLEVFIAGSYTWIPMKYMENLEIEKPEGLRDLIWARARVQTSSAFRLQDLGEVLLPVLSPFSFQQADEVVQLGRSSVWEISNTGVETPFGQKLMWIDGEEIPLLEIRSIDWNSNAEDLTDAPA